MVDLSVDLGPMKLKNPLIAASGTVGAVYDFSSVGRLDYYGAAVAKSVSPEPWRGRPAPRLGPANLGMLNGIGIQNSGIDAWVRDASPHIADLSVPIWGSAVAECAEGFIKVATGLESAGVLAIEVNLSCPNLDNGTMFSFDADASASVVSGIRNAVRLPIGAKLSPETPDIVEVAQAVAASGADWVVLTNTVSGAAIDVESRRPVLSGTIGGYSGTPLKPIALRCVWQVSRALPDIPIVGCGGISSGEDIVEYLLAGATATAVGTAHFDEPRVGARLIKELTRYCTRQGVLRVADLIGAAEMWE